jgi:excisionase family DNA binding protein
MNKSDAANFLGKTERAIERYVKDGRLSARYVAGKTRSVADFDEAELERLKHELDNPSDVRPAVIPQTPTNDEQPRQSATNALQRTANDEAMTILGKAIADALQAHQTQGNTVADVPLRDKMTLSFKEAARLSGVPESNLRAAFADGSLRGARIGRGVRVLPDDLRKYVAARMKG